MDGAADADAGLRAGRKPVRDPVPEGPERREGKRRAGRGSREEDDLKLQAGGGRGQPARSAAAADGVCARVGGAGREVSDARLRRADEHEGSDGGDAGAQRHRPVEEHGHVRHGRRPEHPRPDQGQGQRGGIAGGQDDGARGEGRQHHVGAALARVQAGGRGQAAPLGRAAAGRDGEAVPRGDLPDAGDRQHDDAQPHDALGVDVRGDFHELHVGADRLLQPHHDGLGEDLGGHEEVRREDGREAQLEDGGAGVAGVHPVGGRVGDGGSAGGRMARSGRRQGHAEAAQRLPRQPRKRPEPAQ